MLTGGDQKRFHLLGPHLAGHGVVDHNLVVLPKANKCRAGLVDLDDCVSCHPSMMHEHQSPGGSEVPSRAHAAIAKRCPGTPKFGVIAIVITPESAPAFSPRDNEYQGVSTVTNGTSKMRLHLEK
jgi:hypothetical protein